MSLRMIGQSARSQARGHRRKLLPLQADNKLSELRYRSFVIQDTVFERVELLPLFAKLVFLEVCASTDVSAALPLSRRSAFRLGGRRTEFFLHLLLVLDVVFLEFVVELFQSLEILDHGVHLLDALRTVRRNSVIAIAGIGRGSRWKYGPR